MTATEILTAACESKIACLNDKDLMIVIAEAIAQGAGGGGGTVAPVYQSTVDLTNAQILALPSTPVVIVPATEVLGYVGMPTRIPIVNQGIVRWKAYAGVAYGNLSGTLSFFIGSDAGNGGRFHIDVPSFFGFAAPFLPMAQVGTPANQNDAINAGQDGAQIVTLLDSIQDNAISFWAVAGGNFTNGDPSDIMQVSVSYMIFNTQTGQFE